MLSSCNVTDILDANKEKNQNNDSIEIGTDGGTITVDDLTITIPAGAFTQTANIKVTQTGSNNSAEDIVTPIYSIEGLPDNYSLPIDVTIKINGTTNNETYLIVQTKSFVQSLHDDETTNIYFNASISGDLLKSQIPSLQSSLEKNIVNNNGTNLNATSSFSILNIFGASNKKSYTTENNHFKITYDATKDNIANITSLGQYLENSYSIIKNIGFDYSRRTKWPVNVYIEDLEINIYGYFKSSHFGLNSDYMRFNRLNLNKPTQLEVTAIHEFFHLVQSLKDPRITFKRAGYPAPHLWFNEACSVWSEDLVSPPDYISYIKDNNTVKEPFEGMQANLETARDATYHGYGMSAFVKYLVTKYGQSILVKIYEKIFNGRNVLDAINNSINYNLFLEYTPFLEQYAQGKIYSDCQYDDLVQSLREGIFRIQTDSDSVKSFSANYRELSAKIFLVRLDNPNFQDDASLNLSVDQDMCDISVFSYPQSGGKVELVGQGQKDYVVQNLKGFLQQGKSLIVMVTNSNFISNNYKPSDLDIKLTMRVKINKKVSVAVTISLDGVTYREKTNNEDWITQNNEKFIFTPSAGVHSPKVGTLQNNIFTSPLDDVYNPLHVESSNIKITFLDNPKRINMEIELVINDATTGIKERRLFIINDIPEEDTGSYWEYGSSLSRASIIDTYEKHDYNGDYYKEFVSFNPSENSKVEVKIN